MRPARPTLRCLQQDMGLPVPPVTRPLEEIDHPLLAKAAERFAEADAKHERIRAIDDQVLFKVKVQRWRGAVWVDSDLPWLVAGGRREDGSGDDFYAALEADGRAARARYNAGHRDGLKTATHSAHLLPERADFVRYRAEAGVRFVRRLRATVLGWCAIHCVTDGSTVSTSTPSPWASRSVRTGGTRPRSRYGSPARSLPT
ncbi:hypothetical protein ACIQGZ_02170 [Streptomyces sp. NPDC092296]|uniref:hypothetical protein n=1 Tax=Streptomyces sp. NPDC092296 TaxID=3366012 RepID=UPI0037F950B1